MSDDQDGCEWMSVSSGTSLPGLSRTKGARACVRACVNMVRLICDEKCFSIFMPVLFLIVTEPAQKQYRMLCLFIIVR